MITATAVYGYLPGFVLRALQVRDHLIQLSQPHCGVRIEAVVGGHRRHEREASLAWPPGQAVWAPSSHCWLQPLCGCGYRGRVVMLALVAQQREAPFLFSPFLAWQTSKSFVIVSSGCCKKMPQTGELKLQTISSQVWRLRKEYIKAVNCHLAYLTYMQSTSWEMLDWMKHKLESGLLGEISITSDMQMTPLLSQKVKKN